MIASQSKRIPLVDRPARGDRPAILFLMSNTYITGSTLTIDAHRLV